MSNPDSSAPNTWRRYLYDRTPAIFKAFFGVRYMGSIGLLFDTVTQGLTDALFSPYVESNLFSLDAIEPVSNEMSIPPLPTDDTITHRARILNSWDTWAHAGAEYTMEKQIELGTGFQVTFEQDPTFSSWSDFTVDLAPGTHSITNRGTPLGSFVLGRPFPNDPPDPATNPLTYLGPQGISTEDNYALRNLVVHWKPSHWRCTYARFFIAGEQYGGGTTYGDGSTYGGEFYLLPVQV